MILDYKDKRPLYEQLVDKLSQMIISGVYQAGELMPSVRSLAKDLQINPNTIHKAYNDLEDKGFIYTVAGKGCFVEDSSSYLLPKQKEWKKECRETIREGKRIQVAKKEVEEIVDSVYKEVEK